MLLTEVPLNPLVNREKAAELLFETFNVPALFIAPQAILSLYASGRTTGVVLDSGDGVSHVVPVYEGFALPHAITRTDVAGRDVTDQLQLLLRRSGYNLQTSAEKELVRHIKEEKCYVAYNPRKEEEHPPHADSYRLPDGTSLMVGVGGGSGCSHPISCLFHHPSVSATPPPTLPFPPFSQHPPNQIGAERFRAPEILFRPELVGSEEKGTYADVCEGSRGGASLHADSHPHPQPQQQACTSAWSGAS